MHPEALGSWHLESVAGRGAHGVVWKARHGHVALP